MEVPFQTFRHEKKHESDRSSDEKATHQHDNGNPEAPVNHLVADLPPDPDAHLSPEERAAIVRFFTILFILLLVTNPN